MFGTLSQRGDFLQHGTGRVCLAALATWFLLLRCLADMTTLSAMSAHVNTALEASAHSAYAERMDTTEIGQLVTKTGLKRAEIAEAIGASVASLRRWEHGVTPMPDDKQEALRALATGARPGLRALGTRKPAAAVLAEVPATALIEELSRRARAGRITEPGASSLDARRSLRAVAFTDVDDD